MLVVNHSKIDFNVLLKALDYAKGTILICDKDKNVIFYNKVFRKHCVFPKTNSKIQT